MEEATAGPATGREAARVVALSGLGGALEFYDFIVYGVFASYIGQAFFPSGDALASMLATFAVFGAGYLARPVGGLFFGRRADRRGRRGSFMLSLAVMSLATAAMGLVPSYERWGVAATALFAALRLVQGFCIGGELPGAIAYAAEAVPARRATLACGLVFGCVGAGVLLATGLSAALHALLPAPAMAAWGWRAAFVFGGVLGGLGWLLRRGLAESPVYVALARAGRRERAPVRAVLGAHAGAVLCGVLSTALVGVSNGLLFAHMPAYLVRVLGYAPREVATAMSACVTVQSLGLVAGCWLADRVGRAGVYRAGCALIALGAVPAYAALAAHAAPLPVLLAVVGLGLSLTHGTFAALLADLFPAGVRSTGVGVALNVGALLSGASPVLATGLLAWLGWAAAPGLLVAAVAAVGLVATAWLPRHAGHLADRPGDAPGGVSGGGPGGVAGTSHAPVGAPGTESAPTRRAPEAGAAAVAPRTGSRAMDA